MAYNDFKTLDQINATLGLTIATVDVWSYPFGNGSDIVGILKSFVS